MSAFPLYYELGRNPIQLYDESRLAMNAVEMARNGHWLVPHFDGIPDHWNTKPPLLIWLEAGSFKLFGFSTWAFRLPNLLATLGTVVVLFRFAARSLGRPLAGVFACIVLVTCTGYLRMHVARTGDYDAMLTFWEVLIWTRFFCYLETKSRTHLIWLTVATIAATLTKGPAGLLGFPGLLVYAIGRGKIVWLIRQPSTYIVAFIWIVVMASYFLIREGVDPGYWQAVQENDLGGRFLSVLDGHKQPWDYYLQNVETRLFNSWLWAVAPSLLVAWFLQPVAKVKAVVWMLVGFVVSWLLVVSSASSKLDWYDAPIYPALALIVGIGLSILYQYITSLYDPSMGRAGLWLVRISLLLFVIAIPYYSVITKLIGERHSDFESGPDGNLGRYVNKLSHTQPDINKITLLSNGMYNTVLLYYKYEFEQKPGRELNTIVKGETKKLTPNTVVVICDPALRPPLDSAYQVMELHQDGSCQTLLLLPR